MQSKVCGLILRETDYKESDKLLTVLTEPEGLVTIKARGVRSRSSRLKGACQLFCYAEFTCSEFHGYQVLQEATPIEQFPELRQDLEKLTLASYFAQAAETVSQEDVRTGALLQLTLQALYALCRLPRPPRQVKAVFELRLASYAGYQPELEACPTCGNPEPDGFNPELGTVQCARCFRPQDAGSVMPLRAGTLAAMRFIVGQEPAKLFSFRLSDAALAELGAITESYLLAQFGRSFHTLDYYHSLFTT